MPPRESKARQSFSLLWQHLYEGGLFWWDNNEAMNTHLYSSSREISLGKDRRVEADFFKRIWFEVLCMRVRVCVCTGRRMEGWTHL